MSAPNPDIIDRLTAVTLSGLREASRDYAFLYPSAYGRAANGHGDRVATSAMPDLSNLVVGQTRAIQRDLEDAGRALFEAERRVQIARARLNDAASRIDEAKPVEASVHERAVEHPADRGDVRRAQQAQKRRAVRMTGRVLPWAREEVMG